MKRRCCKAITIECREHEKDAEHRHEGGKIPGGQECPWRAFEITITQGETIMKLKLFGLFVLILMGGLILSGCGCFMQASKGETAPPAAPQAKVVPQDAKKPVAVQPSTQASSSAKAPTILLKDINFDFDRYNVRPGDTAILKKDAEWFKANTKTRVKIEGHCDERGTVEYNLALGQKRADATKNYLLSLGIDGKLIDTVSYGKEKPLDTKHNEEAWAKNRRAHFVPAR